MIGIATRAALTAFAVSSVLGCSPTNTLSQESQDLIAMCSAGVGLLLDVSLETELDLFANGGPISAETTEEIKSAISGSANLNDARVTRVFAIYQNCVRAEMRPNDFIKLLESRSNTVLNELAEMGVALEEIESLTQLMASHVTATKNRDTVLAHELLRRINSIISRLLGEFSTAPYYQVA